MLALFLGWFREEANNFLSQLRRSLLCTQFPLLHFPFRGAFTPAQELRQWLSVRHPCTCEKGNWVISGHEINLRSSIAFTNVLLSERSLGSQNESDALNISTIVCLSSWTETTLPTHNPHLPLPTSFDPVT